MSSDTSTGPGPTTSSSPLDVADRSPRRSFAEAAEGVGVFVGAGPVRPVVSDGRPPVPAVPLRSAVPDPAPPGDSKLPVRLTFSPKAPLGRLLSENRLDGSEPDEVSPLKLEEALVSNKALRASPAHPSRAVGSCPVTPSPLVPRRGLPRTPRSGDADGDDESPTKPANRTTAMLQDHKAGMNGMSPLSAAAARRKQNQVQNDKDGGVSDPAFSTSSDPVPTLSQPSTSVLSRRPTRPTGEPSSKPKGRVGSVFKSLKGLEEPSRPTPPRRNTNVSSVSAMLKETPAAGSPNVKALGSAVKAQPLAPAPSMAGGSATSLGVADPSSAAASAGSSAAASASAGGASAPSAAGATMNGGGAPGVAVGLRAGRPVSAEHDDSAAARRAAALQILESSKAHAERDVGGVKQRASKFDPASATPLSPLMAPKGPFSRLRSAVLTEAAPPQTAPIPRRRLNPLRTPSPLVRRRKIGGEEPDEEHKSSSSDAAAAARPATSHGEGGPPPGRAHPDNGETITPLNPVMKKVHVMAPIPDIPPWKPPPPAVTSLPPASPSFAHKRGLPDCASPPDSVAVRSPRQLETPATAGVAGIRTIKASPDRVLSGVDPDVVTPSKVRADFGDHPAGGSPAGVAAAAAAKHAIDASDPPARDSPTFRRLSDALDYSQRMSPREATE